MSLRIGDTVMVRREARYNPFFTEKELCQIIVGEIPDSCMEEYDYIIVDEEYLKNNEKRKLTKP